MRTYEADVLVVGGGGAALRAALAANEENPAIKILLVTKGKLGKSGVTATACSDRMAFHTTLSFTEPEGKDNWKHHADDIYRIGGYVSDEDLARILGRESQEAFQYLDNLGVPWGKKEGKPLQFVTDGSNYARACFTGPYTGNHIEEYLTKGVRDARIDILEDFMVIDLVLSSPGARIIGAVGLDENERPVFLQAEAIVLATGGAGEAYRTNVYPKGMTGDGYAIGYRAGAVLVNMEFIQIGLSSIQTKLACSGSMMRAIPRFVNEKGEEFLSRYFPLGTPLSEVHRVVFEKGANWPVSYEHKSHVIDIAVYREFLENHKAYLDYRYNPDGLVWDKLRGVERWYREIKKKSLSRNGPLQKKPVSRLSAINPGVMSWFREKGVDLLKGDTVEIAPAAQHFQGGLKIRQTANTSLKGLYAAGECAGGQHGANRPGGNALLDSQVFGRIAGVSAARRANLKRRRTPLKLHHSEKIERDLRALQKTNRGERASVARELVQDLLSRYASIVRTAKGLSESVKALGDLRKKGIRVGKEGLHFALETENLLTVAEMIAKAARERRESRGPHLYFDRFADALPVPRNDKTWNKYIVLRKGEYGMELKAEHPRRCKDRPDIESGPETPLVHL